MKKRIWDFYIEPDKKKVKFSANFILSFVEPFYNNENYRFIPYDIYSMEELPVIDFGDEIGKVKVIDILVKKLKEGEYNYTISYYDTLN